MKAQKTDCAYFTARIFATPIRVAPSRFAGHAQSKAPHREMFDTGIHCPGSSGAERSGLLVGGLHLMQPTRDGYPKRTAWTPAGCRLLARLPLAEGQFADTAQEHHFHSPCPRP